jgi:hypothetical protein
VRIFVWEGDGISSGYHDDGTLVVLAESPEQARELVRAKVAAALARMEELLGGREYWQLESAERVEAERLELRHIWDGREGYYGDNGDEALDRPPDRVYDIDTPTWVAFNGGGYD